MLDTEELNREAQKPLVYLLNITLYFVGLYSVSRDKYEFGNITKHTLALAICQGSSESFLSLGQVII